MPSSIKKKKNEKRKERKGKEIDLIFLRNYSEGEEKKRLKFEINASMPRHRPHRTTEISHGYTRTPHTTHIHDKHKKERPKKKKLSTILPSNEL